MLAKLLSKGSYERFGREAENGIGTVFHYVPLHSSEGGEKFGQFFGEDRFTKVESERLIRLPMWYGLEEPQVGMVAETIKSYINYH